jgi:hypothetical protein
VFPPQKLRFSRTETAAFFQKACYSRLCTQFTYETAREVSIRIPCLCAARAGRMSGAHQGWSEKLNASGQTSLNSRSRTHTHQLSHDVQSWGATGKKPLTKPTAPRLLTSLLPLVREPRTTPITPKGNSSSWNDISPQETQGLFPAPVPVKSRPSSPEVRFC